MQSVILVGMVAGAQSGWTKTQPRGMLPVLGRPLIAWVLDELKRVHNCRVAIAGNGYTPRIRQGLAEVAKDDMPTVHFVEESAPRGPAGAARDAWDADLGGDLLVVEGGLFVSGGLEALLADHRQSGAALTLGYTEQHGQRVPAGVYVLSEEAIKLIPDTGYVDLKEQLIGHLQQQGLTVRGSLFAGHTHKVFRREDHLDLVRHVIDALNDSTLPGAEPSPVIHPEARVHPEADLRGAVYVDRGAVIEAGAVIVGPAHVGAGCVIGKSAHVARSVLPEGTQVASAARWVDSSPVRSLPNWLRSGPVGWFRGKRAGVQGSLASAGYMNRKPDEPAERLAMNVNE
ncbi:MAG: hypothetical protein ACOCXX_03470 [Planctomycetota bacterium]